MPFPASAIITRAEKLLNDAGGVRWPASEILDWINDALREISIYKPTATSKTVTLPMTQGTRQTLPEDYHTFLRAVRNEASGIAITPVGEDVLNAQVPGWHSAAVVPFHDDALHVIDDDSDPSSFHVFPGNTGNGAIVAVVSGVPAPVASAAAAVPLHPVYQNAVVDYVLYRAFSKDINLATSGARAAAFYQQFASAIGVKGQAEASANANFSRPRPQ